MFDSNEKPKNRASGIYISNVQLSFLVLIVLLIVGAAFAVLVYQSNKTSANPILIDNGILFGVDSAQGWQPTGLRLEEGQAFTVQFIEGDWSIFPEDAFRYGPDGGASACGGADCVEPIPNYTKSGLIGRIGDSEPFIVGSYLETTANDSGMLQLRVNDGGTHDNEGMITVLLSSEN
jgi:hypothetical protein